MKIDIHSHILPGIDDGARTLEESVQLVSEMAGWGFERITCTPHITKKFRNTQESIKEKFDMLSNAVSRKGLDIELRMSAEYRLNPETWPEILSQGQLMPIEDQYILMEFPINDPTEMGDLIPMEEFRKVRKNFLDDLAAEDRKPLRRNSDYIDRCVSAFLYNATLASQKEKLAFYHSRNLSQLPLRGCILGGNYPL